MRYESVAGLNLPKVGFGTWNIGGGYRAERQRDQSSLRALRSAIEIGYTHFDTAEIYAAGHSEELLGRALRETHADRRTVIVTTKVAPHHLSHSAVLESCEDSLRRLRSDYVDLYLIHWPGPRMELEPTFQALNELVERGKVHHVGVSNFDTKLLKEATRLCQTPIITDQVPYSVQERAYSKNGVLQYCTEHGIVLTAYSPFEQGKLALSQRLNAIAAARSATPHQIALAWLCFQRAVITIPMSQDPQHQRENLEAADIVLMPEEMELLGLE
jgi:diketogulonate reductase-like aldo/keto reductase